MFNIKELTLGKVEVVIDTGSNQFLHPLKKRLRLLVKVCDLLNVKKHDQCHIVEICTV